MKPSELLALRAEIGADLDELARVVEEIQLRALPQGQSGLGAR